MSAETALGNEPAMVDDLDHVPFILLAWLRAEQPVDASYLLFSPPNMRPADPWSLYTEPYCDAGGPTPQ